MKCSHTVKKKSSNLRSQIKLENMEKLSGILKFKYEDFFIIITEKYTGEKNLHCWQRNISSEMLILWVPSNYCFLFWKRLKK